jgi:hypothetical protein
VAFLQHRRTWEHGQLFLRMGKNAALTNGVAMEKIDRTSYK